MQSDFFCDYCKHRNTCDIPESEMNPLQCFEGVEVVEVVLCRDCIHRAHLYVHEDGTSFCKCRRTGKWRAGRWYCEKGEQR